MQTPPTPDIHRFVDVSDRHGVWYKLPGDPLTHDRSGLIRQAVRIRYFCVNRYCVISTVSSVLRLPSRLTGLAITVVIAFRSLMGQRLNQDGSALCKPTAEIIDGRDTGCQALGVARAHKALSRTLQAARSNILGYQAVWVSNTLKYVSWQVRVLISWL